MSTASPGTARVRRLPQRQRASERRTRHRRTAPRTSGPLTRAWWQRPHMVYAVPSRGTIGRRVHGSAALVFALAETAMLRLFPEGGAAPTLVLLIATLVAACTVDVLLQRRTMRRHDLAWYCRHFPRHVRADGRIACRHCGDRRIATRPASRRTGHTATVCTNCSATLHYSEPDA